MHHARDACVRENARERSGVILMRMHAARGHQAHEVTDAAAPPQACDQVEQCRRFFDLVVTDGIADAREILHHDAASADVEVPNLGIPHLPFRKADVPAGGVQEGMRTVCPEPIEHGGSRLSHRIVSRRPAEAPAVQHHQHDRATLRIRLSLHICGA